MDDKEAEAFARDARAHGEALMAAESDRDIMAEAEAAYKEMYGGGPESIGNGEVVTADGRGQWQGGSLVWDAVDWSM